MERLLYEERASMCAIRGARSSERPRSLPIDNPVIAVGASSEPALLGRPSQAMIENLLGPGSAWCDDVR